MNTFAKLAQKNVDLYNAHPTAHTAITVVYAVGTLVVVNKLVKRIATSGEPPYVNQP